MLINLPEKKYFAAEDSCTNTKTSNAISVFILHNFIQTTNFKILVFICLFELIFLLLLQTAFEKNFCPTKFQSQIESRVYDQ